MCLFACYLFVCFVSLFITRQTTAAPYRLSLSSITQHTVETVIICYTAFSTISHRRLHLGVCVGFFCLQMYSPLTPNNSPRTATGQSKQKTRGGSDKAPGAMHSPFLNISLPHARCLSSQSSRLGLASKRGAGWQEKGERFRRRTKNEIPPLQVFEVFPTPSPLYPLSLLSLTWSACT